MLFRLPPARLPRAPARPGLPHAPGSVAAVGFPGGGDDAKPRRRVGRGRGEGGPALGNFEPRRVFPRLLLFLLNYLSRPPSAGTAAPFGAGGEEEGRGGMKAMRPKAFPAPRGAKGRARPWRGGRPARRVLLARGGKAGCC